MAGVRRVLLVTVLVCLAGPAAAQGAVTLGAPLTGTLVNSPCTTGPVCTHTTLTAPSDRVLTASFDGVLVRWSVRVQNATGTTQVATLRVLRLVTAPSTFLGVRSGAPEPVPVGGDVTSTFATRVPISGGDRIGVDLPQAISVYAADLGGQPVSKDGWDPLLGNGETRASSVIAGGGAEVQVQAILEPDADHDGFGDETQDRCSTQVDTQGACNAFSFRKLKRNKAKGTATLSVGVPGPGTLVVTGKGLVKQRPGRLSRAVSVVAKTVGAAGNVNLRIKSKGRKKLKLDNTGAVRVKARVTYSPTGGDPLTQAKRIKLVKLR